MRIISGEFRGRVLKSPGDYKTRPTSDRLRETLFNILQNKIDESTKFLDLCAGTGAIGIEAISRGTGFVSFVDLSRKACALIEENLDLLGIPENKTEVFLSSAEKFISRENENIYDVIFYDPPYSHDYFPVLEELGKTESKILAGSGLVIVEHHSKNFLPDAINDIRRWRIVKQGETHLSFFEKK